MRACGQSLLNRCHVLVSRRDFDRDESAYAHSMWMAQNDHRLPLSLYPDDMIPACVRNPLRGGTNTAANTLAKRAASVSGPQNLDLRGAVEEVV